MKKLLIGLVLSVAMSAPVFAEQGGNDHVKMHICGMIEELATAIMESRQLGVSLTQSLAIAGDESSKRIVLDAYDQPAMRTPENAQRQRTEFGVKWMLECIKNT